MPNRLDSKTALVTGSTSGIGRAIAEAFAAEGATVLVSGRRGPVGRDVRDGIIEAGGRAIFVEADLAGDVRALAEKALELAEGQIDILVNNAAQLTPLVQTADTTEQVMDRSYAVNIRAPVILTGELAPLMAARHDGVVLNIGSVNGRTGLAGTAFYSATKAAIESLTRTWAAEYGRFGVRVNAILPGGTETAWNLEHLEHFVPMLAKSASGRLSTLAELAAAAVFLASAESSNIHGVALPVDGGYLAVSRVNSA
jgi:NAD(P)-dependent dehydrogenase (short-subunit alcohol dehydrogenase family)